jgi:hypothetical protein
MARIADRIVYRLAGLWWMAIYAGLVNSPATRGIEAPLAQSAEPAGIAAERIAVAA